MRRNRRNSQALVVSPAIVSLGTYYQLNMMRDGNLGRRSRVSESEEELHVQLT